MKKSMLLSLLVLAVSGCAEDSSLAPGSLPLTEIRTIPANHGSSPKEPTATKLPEVSEVGPWPKFVAEELTYDFGQMQVGTKLEHLFKIRNEGDAPLEMVAGKSTCKCTKFALGKLVLQPGEETELHIEWHGKFQDRAFQHGGPVYTNDPKGPERRFVVKGIVDDAYQIMPSGTWKVDHITSTSAGKMRSMFCSRIFDTFEITKIKNVPPLLSVTTEPMDAQTLKSMEARSGYFVNVEVSPEVPAGLLEESFELVVDKGQVDPVQIAVSAAREGAIRVVNTSGAVWVASKLGLKLGHFQARAGKEAVMTLSVRNDEMPEPLKIVSSTTSPRFLSVTLEPTDSTSKSVTRYQLKVRVPPGSPKSRKSSAEPATVEIETNHPQGELFKFQVTFNSF